MSKYTNCCFCGINWQCHALSPSHGFALQPQEWFFKKRYEEIANVIIGVPCLLGLTVGGLLYSRRMYQAWRSGKRWCAALHTPCWTGCCPKP